MKFTANPALRTEALNLIREEYGMNVRRPGVHQSELSHCLTLSYYDRTEPLALTDREAMLFAIGFAAERVMLRLGEVQPEAIEVDGITMSLDSINLLSSPFDLKTSRLRAAGRKGEGGFQAPLGWVRQFASYLVALNSLTDTERLTFSAVVMHLVEPELTAWNLEYTHNELAEHWGWLTTRHSQLDSMFASGNPMPFTSNEEWECGTGTDHQCRYLYRCQLWKSIESREFG